MNMGKFEGRLAVSWDSMLCVLFAATIIQRIQEIQIGMQLTWVDWILMLLCLVNLVCGVFLLASPHTYFKSDAKVTPKSLWIGWLLTLAIFALLLISIVGISNVLTDVIIILATLALLVGALMFSRK